MGLFRWLERHLEEALCCIALSVIAVDGCSDDVLARGALEFSTIAKEAQAIANLANTVEQVADLIPL